MLKNIKEKSWQFVLSRLPRLDLKELPEYREDEFWIHQNGILKGDVLYALWERMGNKIRISYYGHDPKSAEPKEFDTLGEAISYLEKL